MLCGLLYSGHECILKEWKHCIVIYLLYCNDPKEIPLWRNFMYIRILALSIFLPLFTCIESATVPPFVIYAVQDPPNFSIRLDIIDSSVIISKIFEDPLCKYRYLLLQDTIPISATVTKLYKLIEKFPNNANYPGHKCVTFVVRRDASAKQVLTDEETLLHVDKTWEFIMREFTMLKNTEFKPLTFEEQCLLLSNYKGEPTMPCKLQSRISMIPIVRPDCSTREFIDSITSLK